MIWNHCMSSGNVMELYKKHLNFYWKPFMKWRMLLCFSSLFKVYKLSWMWNNGMFLYGTEDKRTWIILYLSWSLIVSKNPSQIEETSITVLLYMTLCPFSLGLMISYWCPYAHYFEFTVFISIVYNCYK